MGFFRFFFRSPVRIVLSVIFGLVAVVVLFVLVVGVLAFTGGPGPCTPGGGPIDVSDANAASFTQKWDSLDAALSAGAPSTITLTESEITSRAQQFVDKSESKNIKDIRVCIHNGYGEATGKADVFIGSVKFKASGSVDLSGTHPKINFDSLDVGNVPSFIAKSLVQSVIQDHADDINMHHKYTVTLTEGQAKIEGQP